MDIITKVQEYKVLREKLKAIESQINKLAKEIKQSARESIVEDDKGNHLQVRDGLYYGARAVNRIKYNIDVAEQRLSPEVFNSIVAISKKIDQAKLELALKNGLVKEEDVLSFMENNMTYSIVVQEVEPQEEEKENIKKAKVKIKVKPFIKK